MKKLIVTSIFAAASFSAAAGVTGFTGLNYDRANSGQFMRSQYELTAGASMPTKFGTVDGALVATQLNSVGRDDGLGFEIGYSNGLKFGKVSLTGRAAYGRVNQVDTLGGGFAGNTQYYSLGAEASMPVAKNVTGFVGFRHRNGLDADTPAASNRYSLGADVLLNKKSTVRLGYTHTRQASETLNGFTTSINYKF